jgi:riboflavin synthase
VFTGIVTHVGRVRRIAPGGDPGVEIACPAGWRGVAIGASVACAGVCLTVVGRGRGWFRVTVSKETRARTTAGGWRVGTPVNLERALRAGDELGGHFVAGHVDGVGRVRAVAPEGDSLRLTIEAPRALARFVAPKGSVAVDGVSLTVNEVAGRRFGVNLIPYTRTRTALGRLAAGDRVNLEIDMLARYVARLLGKDSSR